MRIVKVPLGDRSYRILIGRGLLSRLGVECSRLQLGRRCAIISDRNVAPRFAKIAQHSLKQAGFDSFLITVPAGETAKSMKTVESCYDQLAMHRLERNSFIIALGGGVVGDLAGFVAASYLRGIAFVQAPTTLLAQVDAAIGGKTGVNLSEGKNLVGTFHQPRAVLVDTQVLSTLSGREFRAGVFEVVKSGIIGDKELFEYCEERMESILSREPKALLRIISASAILKAKIVASDEREGGLRRILNFGHTVGHALEAESGYSKFLHGEAVGWGMIAAANIGVACRVTPAKVAERIAQDHRFRHPRFRRSVENGRSYCGVARPFRDRAVRHAARDPRGAGR